MKKPLAEKEMFQNPKPNEMYMCCKTILQYSAYYWINTQRFLERYFITMRQLPLKFWVMNCN